MFAQSEENKGVELTGGGGNGGGLAERASGTRFSNGEDFDRARQGVKGALESPRRR